MNEIFQFSKNSVCGIQIEKPKAHTVQFESECTVYLGTKIWYIVPENI